MCFAMLLSAAVYLCRPVVEWSLALSTIRIILSRVRLHTQRGAASLFIIA
jgi:hypothetical protein